MKLVSKVTVPETDLKTAEAFSRICYWEDEAAELFTEDFTFDIPYAPPGMYQSLKLTERTFHFDWLKRTTSNWVWSDIKALGTNREGIFWVFRNGEGDTFWGGKEGHYKSKFATLLKIKDGKISYFKDHFDPVAFYKAIGVELPKFYFGDAKPVTDFAERKIIPADHQSQADLEKQVKDTLEFFESPNYWDPKVNEVLSEDFLHELTFAPENMKRFYSGREYDSLNEWLDRHLLGGGIYDELFYETTDPHIYITEYNCCFETNWGYTAEEIAAGAHGIYPNREISYIELDDDGRCLRLDEYLNTMSKFLSTGVSIPIGRAWNRAAEQL